MQRGATTSGRGDVRMGTEDRAKIARVLVLASILLIAFSLGAFGIKLGDVSVTLQSQRYFAKENLTRFSYRVTSPSKPHDQYLVLGVGACVTPDVIDAATSAFEWAAEPFRGLRFESTKRRQTFRLWLIGRWEVGTIDVAVVIGDIDAAFETFAGEIDGPFCEAAGLSIAVVSGGSPTFPAIDGPDTFPGSEQTLLRVTSGTAGWSVSHALGFETPEGASHETLERVLEVQYGAYAPQDGITDIGVSYALILSEEDFDGLPEGDYVINITFMVAEN